VPWTSSWPPAFARWVHGDPRLSVEDSGQRISGMLALRSDQMPVGVSGDADRCMTEHGELHLQWDVRRMPMVGITENSVPIGQVSNVSLRRLAWVGPRERPSVRWTVTGLHLSLRRAASFARR
jgi:hypothetical protein